MQKWRKLWKYPEIWVIAVVALFTRLIALATPNKIVFDEVYFREFAGNYLSGNYFFDIHPPLAKLLFGAVAWVGGFSPFDVAYSENATFALRVLPALAGTGIVVMMYIIARQIGLGRKLATLVATLVLFDGALIVESRFVLMDSFLLLAGLGALSAYIRLGKTTGKKRWKWVVLLGVMAGILVSIKWTGLAIVGLLLTTWLVQTKRTRRKLIQTGKEILVVVFITSFIYISCFALHFALLDRSGMGDDYMSQQFQSTLVGSKYYDKTAHMSFWAKFVELNREMFTSQSTLKGVEHPYASKWYTWPVEARPVYYWQGEVQKDGKWGNIYLLGNPVVWWGSLLGVIAALLLWLFKPSVLGKRRNLVAFLLAGYAVNYAPFAFIDRPMFLYHYLFALLFSVLILATMLSLVLDWQAQKYSEKAVDRTFITIGAVVVISFLYFVPFTYGVPMLMQDILQHQWLQSWR
jgi:dolichyl-phosphate-mannose-protein mannosyltransferase